MSSPKITRMLGFLGPPWDKLAGASTMQAVITRSTATITATARLLLIIFGLLVGPGFTAASASVAQSYEVQTPRSFRLRSSESFTGWGRPLEVCESPSPHT